MDANDNRKRWILRSAALLAAAAVGLVAWSRRDTYAPLDVGAMAPAYEARSLSGDTVRLQDHRGRVVLVNVWATWCRPCIREMPAMQAVYDRLHADGFDILAVSVDNAALSGGMPSEAVRDFVDEYKLTFPVLVDPESRIENAFPVSGLPMSYLIDRSGRVRGRYIGPREWDTAEMEAEIRSLLES